MHLNYNSLLYLKRGRMWDVLEGMGDIGELLEHPLQAYSMQWNMLYRRLLPRKVVHAILRSCL